MNEREQTMAGLRMHATAAKLEIETVLAILGWPNDTALSRAIDRLVELQDLSS
jgi:hypothetical protein